MKIVIPIQQRLAHPKRHKCQLHYKKQEWSEDQKTVTAKCPGKEGKQTFEDKFYVIDGSEGPERMIMWMKDFKEKIMEPSATNYKYIDLCFLCLTDGDLRTKVRDILNLTNKSAVMKVGQIGQFSRITHLEKLNTFTTQKELDDFRDTDEYQQLRYILD